MKGIYTFLFCLATFLSFSQQYDYAKLLGGVSGDARGQGIVRDNAGNIFMKGVFSGALKIGGAIYQATPQDAFFCKNDINGNFEWFKKIGFNNVDVNFLGDGDITIDASNNVYIIGSFSGDANIEGNPLTNAGSHDVYIIKYDPNGNLIWVRNIGGSGTEVGDGIAVDATGAVYVTGNTRSSSWVFDGSTVNPGFSGAGVATFFARLNPDGSDDWIQFIASGTNQNEGRDILTDGSFVYLAGKVNQKAFVGKYSAFDGSETWSTETGNTVTQVGPSSESYALALNGSTLYIAGEFRASTLQFGPLPVLNNNGGADIFISSFDTDGNPQVSVSFGSTSSDGVRDISVTGGATPIVSTTGTYGNTITIGGSTLLSQGPFVATFSGSLVPGNAIGFQSSGFGEGLGLDSNSGDNAVYVTGTYQGDAMINGNPTVQKTPTFFIQRYQLSTLTEVFGLASPKGQVVAQYIERDNSNNLFLTGYFDGTVDLLGTRIVSTETGNDEFNPMHDLFIAKLNPDASLDWVVTAGGLDNDIVKGLTTDGEGSVYINAEFINTPTIAGVLLSPTETGRVIAKVDASGNYVYAQSFSSVTGDITSIEGDRTFGSSDQVFVAGYFSGAASFQGNVISTAGDNDIFITKMDGGGNISFGDVKQYGSTGDDIATSLSQIFIYAGTTMVMTGHIEGSVDFDGTVLSATGRDIFITTIDDFLNAFNSIHDGGANDQEGQIVNAESGTIYVTGGFSGAADFGGTNLPGGSSPQSYFLASYQSDGTFRWANEIVPTSTSSNSFFTDMAADGSGHLYVTGGLIEDLDFSGNVLSKQGDNDGFFAQYDNNGNFLFGDALGSSYSAGGETFVGFEFGYGLVRNSSDEIWLTGTLTVKEETIGPFTLMPYAVDNPGESMGMDSYLAKYNPTAPPGGQSKVYWTEESGNQINRANLDGTFFEQYYSGFSIFPQGIAYDDVNEFIYWTDTNGKVRRGQIGSTGFSTFGDFIDESTASRRDNLGIALDVPGDKIYWVSNWDGTIKTATLSAPVPISTLQTPVSGLSNPKGVAVDPAAGKMYYTENNDPGDNIGELHQANLDGSGDIVLYSDQRAGLDYLFNDLKLDLTNNKIYWSVGEVIGTFPGFGEIFSADLSNVSGTVTSFATPGQVVGIDLDIAQGKIYWVDRGVVSAEPARIMRANLDGSSQEVLREGFSENISTLISWHYKSQALLRDVPVRQPPMRVSIYLFVKPQRFPFPALSPMPPLHHGQLLVTEPLIMHPS